MELTAEEKESNYEFLINAIQHVERGRRITEDWIHEQSKRILYYRDFWPDLSRVNPDITDHRFRSWAVEVETLLTSLCSDIKKYRTFPVGDYHRFNMCVKRMSETFETDDDFVKLMSMMKF
jgi:hypothetical protein